MTSVPLTRISGMKTSPLSASLVLVLIAAACGGSNAATDSAGTAATSSVTASSASSKAVPHGKLAEFLPAMSGWTRDADPQGDTDTASNVSRIQVGYTKEGGMGGIGIELMDVTSNQQMIAPLKELLKITGTKNTAAGTQKVVTIKGFTAIEEWLQEAGNGSVSVLVGDRFVVAVTGSSVGNVDVIHQVVQSIDLNKIAALK
jgi:hypothetical protein